MTPLGRSDQMYPNLQILLAEYYSLAVMIFVKI